MKVNVIGACNIDISATPYKKIKMNDSNPGKINVTLGGVGRNIANNLANLKLDVNMFTAISTDNYGKMILDSSKKIGINLDNALITSDYNQSIYLCMNDENGDMLVGSSDMDICSLINLDYIKTNLQKINDCDALVFDTNLNEDTINYILANSKVKCFVDCVSANKCIKIASILSKQNKVNLYMIKANKVEAEILGNRKIETDNDLILISNYLHSKGIQNVCITLGEKGAYLSNGDKHILLPNKKVNIVNATGAGDAFISGMIYGCLNNKSLEEIGTYGLSAAKITLESLEAVSDKLTADNLLINL